MTTAPAPACLAACRRLTATAGVLLLGLAPGAPGAAAAETPEDGDSGAAPFHGTALDLALPAWAPEGRTHAAGEAPRFSGAMTLAPANVATAIHLGFPYMGLDLGVGITEPTDVRIGFRTVFGGLSRFDVGGRFRVRSTPAGQAVSVRGALAYTTFRRGELAMRMTGQRPYGLHGGVVVSTTAGLATLFADAGLELVLDLDPISPPLGGRTSPYELRANVPLHAGLEVAMAGRLAFVTRLGFDFFPGERDTGEPVLLPHLSAGITLIH